MKGKYLLLSAMALLSVSSCKKFLDKAPLDKIATDVYYTTQTQVDMALTACYSRMMRGGWDGNIGADLNVSSSNAIFDCFADNGFIKWGFLGITSGNLNPNNTAVQTIYEGSYSSIAIFNDFIINLESPKVDFLQDAVRKKYIAEVKFMRAYVYFTLTNLYGDVALTLKPEGADYQPARAPKDQVTAAVLEDLDYAIANLPNDPYVNGRVVKGAAYALKMKALLYKGDNAGVISIWNGYFNTPDNKFSMSPKYYDLFRGPNQSKNPEIIFSAIYVPDQRYRNDIDITLTNYADVLASTGLLHAYEFNDGTPFSTANPKYDPANEYNNRDPRLKYTLFNSQEISQPASPYYGKIAGGNVTGKLIVKKFVQDELLPAQVSGSDQDAVLLRLGDVALMYAEAENTLNGPGSKVIDAVQMVRGRADVNMPALPAGLSKEAMRDRIRQERRIELAFEGQRYFDLLRWRLMADIIPQIVDPNGIRRVWEDKNYLWPLPTNALSKNPKLTQNTGYPRL
jgi:hypothetical protein